MRFVPARSILFALVFASAAVACESKQQFIGACEKNNDCGVGAFCKKTGGASTGLCACRTDEACAEGEICNMQSICQKRDACRSNMECGDRFCDLSTGNCIDRTGCGSDVHCLPGSVCTNGKCTDGCFDDADCKLYSVCDRMGATSSTALGQCFAGRCSDKTFCEYGDLCTSNGCIPTPNPNHCKDCSADRDCGSASNFCLVNPAFDPRDPRTGTEQFCGVECRSEIDCPSGYNCGGVILLTQDQCTNDGQCGGGGRVCVIGEGNLRGFCTCASNPDCTIDEAPPTCLKTCGGFGVTQCETNMDCIASPCQPTVCQWPQNRMCARDDQCEPLPLCAPVGPGGMLLCVTDGSRCAQSSDCLCFGGSCVFTGRPCTTSAQCLLECQGGGCFLGSACAPLQGLNCPDVR